MFQSCGSEKTSQSNTEAQPKKVLFVLTSHDQMGNTGEKTGFWIEEFATPYYFLKDQGVEITLASPKGGQPPFDPRSDADNAQTPSTKRFKADQEAQKQMANTLKLSAVKADDYDAIFYPGGHGPLWDLSTDKTSIALIESFYNAGKPVSAVCHAPAVFKETKAKDGSPLVKGKKVTGFSDEEEAAINLTEVVPFLVEDMLKENGGIYSRGDNWAAYAVEDGLLITGQNPASSELVAKKLLAKLTK
ncbi:type 1 glutamine amidotransferase domain-containing protein [Flammeovirga sp. SubArs3]